MEFLVNVAIRSVLLAGVAGIGLWICRVRSAQVRHAVWMWVTLGMLAQVVLGPVLPAVRWHVLRPTPVVEVTQSVDEEPTLVPVRAPVRQFSVDQVAGWIYAAGVVWCLGQLGYAWWFTRRLGRESVAVGGNRYESRRISVPVTVGRRILLPVGWRQWDAAKLRAVIAHEATHVARGDWAVAAMARVNRCVFWFHPLAWWLERTLSRLAEQVCDDAALAAVGDREKYADVLMEMARAAGARGGRVAGAVAMAKEANVEMRINRILDAGRRVPKALGRIGWMGLTTAAVALVYLTAAAQLAPAVESKRAASRVTVTETAAAPIQLPAQRRPTRPEPKMVAQAEAPPAPVPNGPVSVPKVYNGHNKTFYLLNFQPSRDGAVLGTLHGIVLDPSGARVPDATVTVFAAGGSPMLLGAFTDTLGGWSAQVPVGSYSLEVGKTGFVTNYRSVLATMGEGETIRTNLEVAAPVETVMVSATGTPRAAAQVDDRLPRVGGNVQMGRRVRAIQPTYPPSARDQGITGEVVIQALVGRSGKVLETRVTNDAPAELREAALDAVRQWEYTPALLNGEAVNTLTTIRISFLLSPQ